MRCLLTSSKHIAESRESAYLNYEVVDSKIPAEGLTFRMRGVFPKLENIPGGKRKEKMEMQMKVVV